MKRKPVLGYLVSHPIQYQAPLFRRLAASSKIDFVALFGSDFGVHPSFDPQFGQMVDFGMDNLAGYRSAFLPQASKNPSIGRFLGLRTPSIRTFWNTEHPDVVILHGWRTAMMWQAAAGATVLRKPYLMRAETPEFRSAPPNSGLRQFLRKKALRMLLQGSAGVLALGRANERFYLSMGCEPKKIARVPYFVDNDSVAASAAMGKARRERIRADLGINNDAFVVIVVAKLIERKRPFDLVTVLSKLPVCVHLIWVGSGTLQETLLAEAKALGVSDRLHLVGFRPSPETWRLLGASDLFALPAEAEPWGLVINEAVVAGLPAIATDQCGAAEDLIIPDITGDIVPTRDLFAWESTIRKWLKRGRQGDRGNGQEMARLVDEHSIERAVVAIENVVQSINRNRM